MSHPSTPEPSLPPLTPTLSPAHAGERRRCARGNRLGALAVVVLVAACAPRSAIHPRASEELRRGYAYLAAADLERAGIAFEHALAFDPDLPEAHNGLGVVARSAGELELARRRFERAIRLSPEFAEGHANLGEALLAARRSDAAEAELRAALRIDPDLAEARQNLARALLLRGLDAPDQRERWASARREYLHLLESEPERAAAHHDLAFMEYAEGRFERAEAGYRRATELSPRSHESFLGLCNALVRLGRCADAARACEECLALAPGAERCRVSLRAARACE